MKEFLMFLYDFLVPRIVTEDVAVNWDGDEYTVVCPVKELEPYEEHMGVCKIKAFTWLGVGFFGRMEVPPRDFYNPND